MCKMISQGNSTDLIEFQKKIWEGLKLFQTQETRSLRSLLEDINQAILLFSKVFQKMEKSTRRIYQKKQI